MRLARPILSAATAFPPQATAKTRDLAARLMRQLAEAQRTADQLHAEAMNEVEAELLLSGPALFAEMLRDNIEDALYGAWNHGAKIRAADLAAARVIADAAADPPALREAA